MITHCNLDIYSEQSLNITSPWSFLDGSYYNFSIPRPYDT